MVTIWQAEYLGQISNDQFIVNGMTIDKLRMDFNNLLLRIEFKVLMNLNVTVTKMYNKMYDSLLKMKKQSNNETISKDVFVNLTTIVLDEKKNNFYCLWCQRYLVIS